MTKINLKYSTKLFKGSYKQVLESNPNPLDDWLDKDTASIVQKYKDMFEHKEKIDKINIEYHKIGITELKNNLKNKNPYGLPSIAWDYTILPPEVSNFDLENTIFLPIISAEEYMHNMGYDLGMGM